MSRVLLHLGSVKDGQLWVSVDIDSTFLIAFGVRISWSNPYCPFSINVYFGPFTFTYNAKFSDEMADNRARDGWDFPEEEE